MSKSLDAGMAAHIAGEVTTLAYCWRVTRTDGQVFRFTSLDRDLVYGGETYLAATGFTAGAVENNSALNVDDVELVGLLDSPAITEGDLQAALWDHAFTECFLVNWQDATQGQINLRVGWLGEVTAGNGRFNAELRGLAQRLQQTVGRTVTPSCDADLGDARCGVNLASFTVTGTVTAAASRREVTVSTPPASVGGEITFTSGGNAGRSVEVKAISGSDLTLFLPVPYDIAVGDAYSVTSGCDKSTGTCSGVYSNLINFRGFPFIRTTNELMRGPV
jgi:uncharacterized phage protein (TIGR02218 family)